MYESAYDIAEIFESYFSEIGLALDGELSIMDEKSSDSSSYK